MTTYTYTTLDYGSPYRTFLYDINNEGQIIGQYTTYGVNILYQGGSFTALDYLNNPFGSSTYAYAMGINDSGQIAGSWNYIGDLPGALHGFIYTNGTFTDLVDPNAALVRTSANAINNVGQVVGDYAYAPFVSRGFLYSGGVYTDIQYPLDVSALSIRRAPMCLSMIRLPQTGPRLPTSTTAVRLSARIATAPELTDFSIAVGRTPPLTTHWRHRARPTLPASMMRAR
jgi:probable HAF family extracellular repeat protein